MTTMQGSAAAIVKSAFHKERPKRVHAGVVVAAPAPAAPAAVAEVALAVAEC